MIIAPSQHYDLTWLVAIIAVLLILVASDWIRAWWVDRQARKVQQENARLMRYTLRRE